MAGQRDTKVLITRYTSIIVHQLDVADANEEFLQYQKRHEASYAAAI